jgi:formylglycine-generating enzyme required for sulfatase activity
MMRNCLGARSRAAVGGILGGAWTTVARLLVVALLPLLPGLAGCGEQDLYKPPRSPYAIVAQLPLPSICEDVSIIGHTAYVAGGEAGLHTVDLTNPAHPVLKQTLNTTKYAEAVKAVATPSAGGVVPIAFVVEGTEGITTYNISDPDSSWSYNQGTTAVDGTGIFVDLPSTPSPTYSVFLAESWKGMRIFESDPQFPGVLRYNGVFAATRGYAKAVAVANGYAYVADDEMGVAVLDVRVRILGAVRVVSATDTPGNAKGIAISGDYAYVADGKSGLIIMRIDGGNAPVLVGSLVLAGDSRSIEVRGSYAFIAAQDGGTHIVDVSNPADPKLAGTVITPYATGVAVTNDGVVAISDRVGGLYVLTGPGGFPDRVPPAPVADLTATALSDRDVRLSWTAPGDNAFYGTAASYEIRLSLAEVTEANWDAATLVAGSPVPQAAGTRQSLDVSGLAKETGYFFALKTRDSANNLSALSNLGSATTFAENVPPVLTGATVSPQGAAPGSTFTFSVTYQDGDGDAPTRTEVVINGVAYTMSGGGTDYRAGVVYRYEAALQLGAFEHLFVFDDGQGHEIRTATVAGPWVGEPVIIGSPASEPFRDVDEDQHLVVIPWEVSISDHEVTQAEFEHVLGAARNLSHFRGDSLPVENVTWYDAVEYCNALSVHESLTPAYTLQGDATVWNREANGYRLPTEAEWERAARAGTTTPLYDGELVVETCRDPQQQVDANLDQIGWYCGNAGVSTHPIKRKAPNAGGLYDMSGNVWEWCWDWYSAPGVIGDPTGPATGSQRVIRGGSWYYFARDCRSAARAPYWPNSKDDIVGFRVARTVR